VRLALGALIAALALLGCAQAQPRLPALGVAAGPDLGKRNPVAVTRELNDYTQLGVRWVRHDFAWDVAEPARGAFNWAPTDIVVVGARLRRLNVLATITYTPPWANGGHADHRFAPTDPWEFGRFAGRVARRYAPLGVHAYEIWNEPNIHQYWQPLPDPAFYARLMRAAAFHIRAVDPAATIVTGGTSPARDSVSSVSPLTWLRALYANGTKDWFDAIGHHPYVDADMGPDSTDPGNPWHQMAGSPGNMRSIQAANGDSATRIWATEVGCRQSLGRCEQRLGRAVALWRTYPWAGVLTWFTYWDPNEYGLVSGDWSRRPVWYALRSSAAGL
jgi:hypothetical protein